LVRLEAKLTRRRFLALVGGLTTGALGLGGYAWRVEPEWVEVVRRDLPIVNLPAALVDQNLVQISDLHTGTRVDPDYLAAALKRISSLQPALTIITGDFMTCQGTEQLDAVEQVLRYLEPGPLGCFAVLGNHDYGRGWSHPEVAEALVARLSGMGIRTLRNESLMAAGLQLLGIDDLWGTNFHPEDVLPGIDWTLPTLTLCHNPDAVDLPSLAACRGWILAGHTHGGQVKPPFLPPPILPVKNPLYSAGEIKLGDGRRLYINRGLGYLHRVRFNVRPEITVFRMVTG
jgi:uncharacterized protein